MRPLKSLNPKIGTAYELAQGFVRMLRGCHPEMLDGWLEDASTSSRSSEPRGFFAEGLRCD